MPESSSDWLGEGREGLALREEMRHAPRARGPIYVYCFKLYPAVNNLDKHHIKVAAS